MEEAEAVATASTRRRVAFVLTQDRGGPVDVTVALAAGLAEHPSFDVRLFGPMPARDAARVAHLHTELSVPSKGAVGSIAKARRALAEWRPDIVHAQDRRSGLVCSGLSWRRSPQRLAVVHTYHGVPDDVSEPWFRGQPAAGPTAYTRLTLAVDALVARTVNRTVVPAASMGWFLHQRLHVPQARIVHIDNGLPLPSTAVRPGPVRRILFVGLLIRRKGVHLLLEALAAAQLSEDVNVQIVGEGTERGALEKQAVELGLASRVQFLGFRSDVPQLLAEADAFVLPSMMEQQPLVLIEAMAAGKAVVATDVGGVKDMIGDVGVVVPPGDVAALAEAIRRLTAADDTGDLGRRAAMRAHQRFSVEHSRERHIALYEELLTRARRGRV